MSHNKYTRKPQSKTGEIGTGENEQLTNVFLQHALTYAAKMKWRVFPCVPRDKRPLIKAWQKRATTDPKQIKAWWAQWPDANVAIATGRGLLVVDVDYRHGGAESLREMRKAGKVPEDPPIVETPGPGCHLYLSVTKDLKNLVDVMPGVDLRGAGGYVIAPPSIHPNGLEYQWGVKP